jgi:hypothetical protein
MPDDPLYESYLSEAEAQEPGHGKRGFWSRLFGRRRDRDLPPAERRSRWRHVRTGFLAIVGLVVLYYGGGMIVYHRIDDDTAFEAPPQPGESYAVAMAVALIHREVDQHHWIANDPFFYPTALLDNAPNYQMGIVAALSRFAIEMTDHIGRTRGSSEVDHDLDRAAGLLKYPGNVWVYNLSTSVLPTASSEAQYRAAERALEAYNTRLAGHQATFEARADNLQAYLERVAADLGSLSAILERRVREHGGQVFDFHSDDVYYDTKGRLYGHYMIVREIGKDFRAVIDEKQLGGAWNQMLASLREAAKLQPLIVRNGAPDEMLQPSHLAAQGFYLLRARTQLREISDILLK